MVTGRDNKVRGVKLLTSPDSKNTEAFRPLQQVIPFEIVEATEQKQPLLPLSPSLPSSTKVHLGERRPKRQAAREGQLRRRLQEKYC